MAIRPVKDTGKAREGFVPSRALIMTGSARGARLGGPAEPAGSARSPIHPLVTDSLSIVDESPAVPFCKTRAKRLQTGCPLPGRRAREGSPARPGTRPHAPACWLIHSSFTRAGSVRWKSRLPVQGSRLQTVAHAAKTACSIGCVTACMSLQALSHSGHSTECPKNDRKPVLFTA